MDSEKLKEIAKSQSDTWWRALSRKGDPLHNPATGPTRAFEAGYLTAIEDLQEVTESAWQALRGGK